MESKERQGLGGSKERQPWREDDPLTREWMVSHTPLEGRKVATRVGEDCLRGVCEGRKRGGR